jgi:metal-sulfur cluster biosynthetic enzyme
VSEAGVAEDPRLAKVWAVLHRVVDPCSIATGVPISLVEMGLVERVSIEGDVAVVVLQLTSPVCMQVSNIREAVEAGALEIDGLTGARCEIDPEATWLPELMAESARERLRQARPVP